MKPLTVLVIGASARALAQSVAKAGHIPLALDMYGDRDLLEIARWQKLKKSDSITASALNVKADGAVFSSGVENNPDAILELEHSGVSVFSSPSEVIRRSRDLSELALICKKHKIGRPKTVLSPPVDGEYLVKPIKSGAGNRIRDWEGEALNPGEYLQEKIEGIPLSAVFVSNGKNAVLLGVSRQFTGEAFLGAAGYAWCGNLMPFDIAPAEREPLLSDLRRIITALVGDLGLSGACGVDFIYDNGRLYLLEINPRICASFELVELLQGVNIFNLHLQALKGKIPAEPEGLLEGPFWGKGIDYATGDGIAPDTGHWPARMRRDIPQEGALLPAGLPICTVISPPMESSGGVIEHLGIEARKIWGECAL